MRLGTAIERIVDNYRYASDKEWIQDKVAWALYYTWKEADDRKTENSSEFPNNCDTCIHNKLEWYSEVCDGCSKAHSNYEPKTEPQMGDAKPIPLSNRVTHIKDEPQPCEWCKFYDGENCFSQEPCKAKTEPTTEDWQDWKDRMWAEAIVTEPTTEESSTVDKGINVRSKNCTTCKHAGEVYEDPCELCYRHSHYEPKDEPQTERSSE